MRRNSEPPPSRSHVTACCRHPRQRHRSAHWVGLPASCDESILWYAVFLRLALSICIACLRLFAKASGCISVDVRSVEDG